MKQPYELLVGILVANNIKRIVHQEVHEVEPNPEYREYKESLESNSFSDGGGEFYFAVWDQDSPESTWVRARGLDGVDVREHR